MKKALLLLTLAVLVTVITTSIFSVSAETQYTDRYYDYTVTNGEATITNVWGTISGNVTVPSTLGGYPVTSIGDRVFRSCGNITSITIPYGVKSIGAVAFWDCKKLTSVIIPDSVTSIGARAFEGSGLVEISMSANLTSIGATAFLDTPYYNDETNWENGVLYIGNCLIKANTSIEGNYTIKDGTKLIANNAFNYCKSLTSIVIPDSVTNIGDVVFYDCSSLTSITIPNSVTSIGMWVLYNCTNLQKVYYTGTQAEWEKITIDSDNESLLNAELITKKSPVEEAIEGTVLSIGVVGEETVIIVPTSNSVAMTEDELRAIFNDESITITSSNGIIGTGCKVTIGEYVVDLVVKGDVDGDGVATVFDALMVKRALANNGFENEALREFAADVDGTTGTTEADVDAILSLIVA